MKTLIITILTIAILPVFGQKISKKKVLWSHDNEVAASVSYLNRLRKDSALLFEDTGVILPPGKSDTATLVIDSELQKLAEKRVLEMINNGRISHRTKYSAKKIKAGSKSECCAYGFEFSMNAHTVLYIIDKGVPSLGHRAALLVMPYKSIGYAAGVYEGKTYSCVLQK